MVVMFVVVVFVVVMVFVVVVVAVVFVAVFVVLACVAVFLVVFVVFVVVFVVFVVVGEGGLAGESRGRYVIVGRLGRGRSLVVLSEKERTGNLKKRTFFCYLSF